MYVYTTNTCFHTKLHRFVNSKSLSPGCLQSVPLCPGFPYNIVVVGIEENGLVVHFTGGILIGSRATLRRGNSVLRRGELLCTLLRYITRRDAVLRGIALCRSYVVHCIGLAVLCWITVIQYFASGASEKFFSRHFIIHTKRVLTTFTFCNVMHNIGLICGASPLAALL